MAIVKFNLDSGANIHSNNSETFDTVVDLGLDEGEWEEMSDKDKNDECRLWAENYLEIWFEEL